LLFLIKQSFTAVKTTNRREFLRTLGLATASCGLVATSVSANSFSHFSSDATKETFFKISLAEWSLHLSIKSKQMDNLDFPVKARKDYGLSAVEFVSQLFQDKAKDNGYLAELKKRCDDNGVRSVLIMCDNEGHMGDTDAVRRQQTVENHYHWVDAAKFLGCHSIRVNCAGKGTREEVAKAGADGLRKLSEYGKAAGINVIVENHGEYSSDGMWLTSVIKSVGMPNCGTLADFNNFCLRKDEKGVCLEWYDRYKGVSEMMPFAKGVSAKAIDFDAQGNCVETDYPKMLSIVKKAGYTGYIGIEYEGTKLSEDEGIKATIRLLEKCGS
jgi:sugar phosphate isomerase/epimerase